MRIDGVELTRTELTKREQVLRKGNRAIGHLSGGNGISPLNVYLAMSTIKSLDSFICFEYGLNNISDYEFFVYRRYIQKIENIVFKYSIGKEV